MKKNKLNVVVFLLIFALLFLLLKVVSAQSLGNTIDSLTYSMQGAIKLLLGDVMMAAGSPGEILFIKLLVFFLLFGVIDLVLRRTPVFSEQRGVSVLVAVIVSLIAVRYITTEQLINFIWLPYGILGVVFSVVLPFIIGFYFIEGFDNPIIRKVGWTTYLVIFAGLAYMRWDTMQTGAWYQNLAWMYLAIAILSGMLLLFDEKIRVMMFMSSMKGMRDVDKRVQAAKISAQIEEQMALLSQTTDSSQRKAIEKKIAGLKASLKAIMRS